MLIGIGWKGKQFRFMAHGGAGRGLVMMANGHVKDALDEKQRIDLEVGKEKEKSKPHAVGKRKPKR